MILAKNRKAIWNKRKNQTILINKLSTLDEDKEELNFWLKIFQDLEPSEQSVLISNLQTELQKLEELKKTEGKD